MINTYQVQINESAPLGKSIVALLRSASDVVSFSPAANDKIQKSLRSGFKDVREIMDGKQERTTIDEFINELRNSNDWQSPQKAKVKEAAQG